MKAAKTLLSVCALGLAGSAFALDYPEERGVIPSIVPAAPDESGTVRNVPSWRGVPEPTVVQPARVEPAITERDVDSYFTRYDANRDAVISRDEAQLDPDLMRVFDRADGNGDRVLSRSEFQDAAVLAVNENRAARGG